MHAGKRHFGSADQVLVIGLTQAVDLVGVGVQEASAAHDFGAHERRGNGQREAVLLSLVNGHSEHGNLHAGHLATQEVEAGAAHLDTAAHVDASHAGAEGQVILGLETFSREVTNLADLLDDHVIVLAALRSFRLHNVGELPHGGGVFLSSCIGLGLELGDLLGEFLGFGDKLGLFVSRGRGDLLADFLLLGAGLFKSLERLTTDSVGGKHFVDEFHGLATLALGFLDDIGVFTNELNIKHEHQTSPASRHPQQRNNKE